MEEVWGPADPSLWVNRPLGYWERELMEDFPPGPGNFFKRLN